MKEITVGLVQEQSSSFGETRKSYTDNARFWFIEHSCDCESAFAIEKAPSPKCASIENPFRLLNPYQHFGELRSRAKALSRRLSIYDY